MCSSGSDHETEWLEGDGEEASENFRKELFNLQDEARKRHNDRFSTREFQEQFYTRDDDER